MHITHTHVGAKKKRKWLHGGGTPVWDVALGVQSWSNEAGPSAFYLAFLMTTPRCQAKISRTAK